MTYIQGIKTKFDILFKTHQTALIIPQKRRPRNIKKAIIISGPIKQKSQEHRLGFLMVRVKGLEPPCREALDPKSSVSTNFTTPALGTTNIIKFSNKISSSKKNTLVNFTNKS